MGLTLRQGQAMLVSQCAPFHPMWSFTHQGKQLSTAAM
ncbi:unnamed protein product [Rhodiola kirilowii]